jgi:uncharacterized phage protein gp47/JayE
MPWVTPTLAETRAMVRDSIRAKLPGADALVPNSVLRVLSDNQGALCHAVLQYIDWLALQLLPDTAETQWLDRHGDIWLVNADGSTGRKMATLSTGTAAFTGDQGSVLPQYSMLGYSGTQAQYETLESITMAEGGAPTTAPIRALDPGSGGNLPVGAGLSIVNLPPGVDQNGFVETLQTGTDTENDDDLRIRVLQRIREPPMGGAQYDYVAWALAVPGVTRAWAASEDLGTVTVRFMMDDLRADNGGFPFQSDIETVAAYIDYRRPVSVKDTYVFGPIPQPIDVAIDNLNPDTTAIRAAIEESLLDMLLTKAAPGQTIYAAWKSWAIMNVPNVISFDLVSTEDDVMPSIGHMATLGDITYNGIVSAPLAVGRKRASHVNGQ